MLRKADSAEAHHGDGDVVRSDALRAFDTTVLELGGDPAALLAKVNISPAALNNPDSVFPYRSMIRLLEISAVELDCADFGLKLASRQGGTRVLGPLHVAMRNARSVGDAFNYCAAHLRVYSSAIRIKMEDDENARRRFMRFEILLSGGLHYRQTVENSLGLTHQAILTLSHGIAGGDEIWFTHSRFAPLSVYRKFFGAPVRFEMPFNAVFMRKRDLALPIVDQDPQLYHLASSYINLQFPPEQHDLTTRVRALAGRLLPIGLCTQDEVAGRLCLHPRTLQRKLKAEGTSFEDIKDGVRRDAALRYLGMPSIPFTRIAAMLGYSESAVLIRSCQRWFSHPPRVVREQLLMEQGNPSLPPAPDRQPEAQIVTRPQDLVAPAPLPAPPPRLA